LKGAGCRRAGSPEEVIAEQRARPVQAGLDVFLTDPRIGLFIKQTPDLVTPKLAALLDYQLSLRTPEPPANSFHPGGAIRPSISRRRGVASVCSVIRPAAPLATSRRASPTC